MKKLVALLIGLTWAVCITVAPVNAATTPAVDPVVNVVVDISSQSMVVKVNGWPYGWWKVSTAREGYYTPRGHFRPFLLKKIHYSKKFDNAAMPNSIFFHYGYAIHATGSVRYLGRPASHGCVRLAPANALKLYNLVQKYGFRATSITIVD